MNQKVIAKKNDIMTLVAEYTTFKTNIDKFEKEIKEAEKKVKDTKNKDKELGAKLEAELKTAKTKLEEAKKKEAARDIANAKTLLAASTTALDAAIKKVQTTNVDSTKYDANSTNKSNIKQREKVLGDEIKKILDEVTEMRKTIEKFDDKAAATLKDEVKKIQKAADDCFSFMNSLFGVDDKKAKAAVECMQKQKTAATALKTKTNVANTLSKFAMTPKDGTLTVDASKVQETKCNGKQIDIKFKTKVYIPNANNIKRVVIPAQFGCVDSNVNKKTQVDRKVDKVTKSTETKLELSTEFSSTSTTAKPAENTKISMNNESIKVEKTKVTFTVNVDANSIFKSKTASIAIMSANNKVASISKPLTAPSTTVTITIPSTTVANVATLVVTVGSTVVAISREFSINPTVKITNPTVKNSVFYHDTSLDIKWESKSDATKSNDNLVAIFSSTDGKMVWSDKVGKSSNKYNLKIKKLPDSFHSGDYFVGVVLNGMTVKSPYTVKIVREKNVFQKIEFKTPASGSSYKKGDTMKITWDVVNPRKGSKLSLFIDVENKLLNFEKRIAKDIDVEAKSFEWKVVPGNTGGDTRYYVIAKYDCGLLTCAQDDSELFAINADLCFAYKKIDIKPKPGNDYDITVTLARNAGCSLTSADKVSVELVRTGNHKKYEASFTFSGDKQNITDTLTLRSGKAFALRFFTKHKNNKDGEPSWEFSAPFDSDFNFDSKSFAFDWGCFMCPTSRPWQITADMKENGWESKWQSFCNIFCKASAQGIAILNSFLKNYNGTNDILLHAQNLKKDRDAMKKAEKAWNDKVKGMVKKLTGCTPSFKLSCVTCQANGSIKLFNFDTSGLNIETGNVELLLSYNIVVRIELSLGFDKMLAEKTDTLADNKVMNDETGKLEDPKIFFDENSAIGKQLNKGLRLDELEIPIWGVKAGLGTTRAAGGIEASVGAALMLFAKIQLKITGKISFLLKADGTIQFRGVVQSDNKYDLQLTSTKNPQPTITFEELSIAVTITASVGGTARFNVAKIIGFEVTLTVAQFTLKAEFRYPPFSPIASKASSTCGVPHKFELTGTLDFFILKLGYTFLGMSNSKTFQIPQTKIEAFKLCFGK